MKSIRLYLLLFLFCSFSSLFAQGELGNGLIFPQFEKGIVTYKNGTQYTASLNYDMIQGKMLFQQADSTILAIGNALEILVVVIDGRRFFPISSSGVFYEEVQAGKGSFFIKRSAQMLSQGKEAAYGGYSQTSSITSYGSWQDSGSSVQLKVNEKFKLDIECFYYLKSGNSYKRFYSAKTLEKLFKGYESDIQKFADEQSIDFSKTDDVARIVEYGYSLNSNP